MDTQASVIPAQLSFLAIYNPSLGQSDETLKDQIVFFFSKSSRQRKTKKAAGSAAEAKASHDEENEQLRQVGLAQGMIDFAKNFSNGAPVDSIDTEKTRVVLHELEKDWWILASIDLTRLPKAIPQSKSSNTFTASSESQIPSYEYSGREVAPPKLILAHLIKAHSIFLLHHGETLYHLYLRAGRENFCTILNHFWTRFIWNWDVLLHGSPAVDIYHGLKLACGGELGIGVGEEEWGSGEREVLEDFISRTEGLVDMVVSRFGDPPITEDGLPVKGLRDEKVQPWLGLDQAPRPSDGMIFSGIGTISRPSLRDISHYLEWIYQYGEDAYGVRDNPNSVRRRRRQRASKKAVPILKEEEAITPSTFLEPDSGRGRNPKPRATSQSEARSLSPRIPPPLVTAVEESLQDATKKASRSSSVDPTSGVQSPTEGAFSSDKMMKYLTLGYGSAWTLPSSKSPIPHRRISSLREKEGTESRDQVSSPMQTVDPTPHEEAVRLEQRSGRWIIGLGGNLDEDGPNDDEPTSAASGTDCDDGDNNGGRRIILRTLTCRMTEGVSDPEFSELPPDMSKRLQIIVYLRQPFVFAFFFELRTPSLSYPSFYRSVHHQLGPLQKSLLSSTSPEKVLQRLASASPGQPHASLADAPLYDLVYDGERLTIRSSIPNIPNPTLYPDIAPYELTPQSPWSRINALNVHTQILNTWSSTRTHSDANIERTVKTGRGWWVLWLRIPASQEQEQTEGQISPAPSPSPNQDLTDSKSPPKLPTFHTTHAKEAILVRKASDTPTSSNPSSSSRRALSTSRTGNASSSRFLRDFSGASSSSNSAGWGLTPSSWGFRNVSSSSNAAVAGSGNGGSSESLTPTRQSASRAVGANVSEGVGVDARRYVEGMLSLNR